jgi:PilZ domain-containing protein
MPEIRMNSLKSFAMNCGPLSEMIRGLASGGTLDRRENSRFPGRAEFGTEYSNREAVQLSGAGKTIDISSGGILFTTSEQLPIGRLVEISVNWPAQLYDTCALQLVAIGRIVRCDDAKAAMRIEWHEFKDTPLRKAPEELQTVRLS